MEKKQLFIQVYYPPSNYVYRVTSKECLLHSTVVSIHSLAKLHLVTHCLISFVPVEFRQSMSPDSWRPFYHQPYYFRLEPQVPHLPNHHIRRRSYALHRIYHSHNVHNPGFTILPNASKTENIHGQYGDCVR